VTGVQTCALPIYELRTPLGAIIGYSEMMREEAEEARDTGYVRDLGKINQAARHLLELIDAILDLAKVEAGRMPVVMQSFDLPELIREVLDSIHPLAEKNRNTLEVDTSAAVSMIECDRTKLFQILLNLLANACKFTEDGQVRLSAGGSREAGWRFVVADTGIGMTPEALRDIFQPFVQADASTTRRYGGSGLGLALVREYVTLLDGDIQVHSVPGQGTRFTLRLPGRRATPGAQPPQT
jgi:signal transduction histidine kinase